MFGKIFVTQQVLWGTFSVPEKCSVILKGSSKISEESHAIPAQHTKVVQRDSFAKPPPMPNKGLAWPCLQILVVKIHEIAFEIVFENSGGGL